MYINNVIKFLNFIFHSSVLFLIIISLYPGSLLGYLLYGDFGTQPNLISNPYGTSINHFIFYFYVSGLGLCLYSKKTNFPKIAYGLFTLSIILELLQFFVPNRAFQLYDLVGNFLGVLVAYFLVKIYLFFNSS